MMVATPLNMTGLEAVTLPDSDSAFQGECTEMGWSKTAGTVCPGSSDPA